MGEGGSNGDTTFMAASHLIRFFTAFATILAGAHARAAAVKPDYHLDIDPERMPAGFFSAETPPVLKVKNGQTVEFDTLALMGLSDDHPEKFFTDNGIPLDLPSVKKMIAVKKALAGKGASSAPLAGPVYIEGAEPGDTLEVRILDIKSYTPFGINVGNPGKGGIPDVIPRPYSKVMKFDLKKNTAKFSDTVDIPLHQFQGIMAVSPTKGRGKLPSRPPYPDIGGNMDNKHLVKGTTLFLPVQIAGAGFYVADPHAAQGNGEVSQSAVESSNTVTLQFFVRKDLHIKGPRAETPTHYIAMGFDEDLDAAMHHTIVNTIDLLKDVKGMNFFDALSLASVAVDYEVTEVVDVTKGVHAMIPKSLFHDDQAPAYWYKP